MPIFLPLMEAMMLISGVSDHAHGHSWARSRRAISVCAGALYVLFATPARRWLFYLYSAAFPGGKLTCSTLQTGMMWCAVAPLSEPSHRFT